MTRQEAARILREYGCRIVRRFKRLPNVYLARVEGSEPYLSLEAARGLQGAGEVLWAHPNLYAKKRPRTFFPDDPLFQKQWHLHNTGQHEPWQPPPLPGVDINAPEAWDKSSGTSSVVVAVVDTAIELTHEDLAGRIVSPTDVIEGTSEFEPGPWEDNHGTCCAGLVGAEGNNAVGVAGVAYDARIMPIRLLTPTNYETPADEAEAFEWALENGAAVISNAWGPIIDLDSPTYHPLPDVVRLAIDTFVDEARGGLGGVVCFAVDNWRTPVSLDGYAGYYNTVAVTLSTDQGLFSDFCATGHSVEVNAPADGGVGVWTTDRTGSAGYNWQEAPEGNYTSDFVGTSAACSLVSGVHALALSVASLNGYQCRAVLSASADPIDPLNQEFPYGPNGHSPAFGFGRVNAEAAVLAALAYTGDDTEPPEAITDLAWTTGNQLVWTAPPDHPDQDSVLLYDLRVSSVPITMENFAASAPISDVTRPSQPGLREQMPIHRDNYPGGWYFALTSIDRSGNRSGLSNVIYIGPPMTPTPSATQQPQTPTMPPTTTPTGTPVTGTATPTPGPDYDWDLIPDALEGGRSPGPGQSNRYLPDSDGDGLSDGFEDSNRSGGADPGESLTREKDTDGDRYTDGIEVKLQLGDPVDPTTPSDPIIFIDADEDELPQQSDYDDLTEDYDGDRYKDGYEVAIVGDRDPAAAIRASGDIWRKPFLGDVNADGVTDNGDSQRVLAFFADQAIPGTHTQYSDVDRNAFIDNADSQWQLLYFARLLQAFPAR
jgi:hypothetical protein